MAHSTAANTAPMTAKFLPYECVAARISRKISLAVCCLSPAIGSAMLGLTDELNSPMAAPNPYPSTQLMNDLNAQLSKAASTSFSSLVFICTTPYIFGMMMFSR
uniref:Uncharacterized protein n=1 Tax=Anopheles melas TaxID=34690 RepID=A0A182UGK4_9DIPT